MSKKTRIEGWTHYKKEEPKPYTLRDRKGVLPLQHFRTREEAEKLARWRCGEEWKKEFEIEEKTK